MFEGFDLAFERWSLWIWWLYAFGVYCLVGFVFFWFRFASLSKAAAEGLPVQVERHDRALRGFPNAVFAKMMGKAKLAKDEP